MRTTGDRDPNYISTLNSTTTPLATGATWAGTFESAVGFSNLSVAVKVLPTTADGTVYVDFSPDGTNVDSTVEWEIASGTIGVPKMLSVTRAFYRVRVVNGSTAAQTTLRLQTILSRVPRIAIPTGRVSQLVNDKTDTINVRAISDPRLDEVLGRQGDRVQVNKWGTNPAVGTSLEDVVFSGGLYSGFLTAGAQLRIRSGGNAADTAAGAGARSVFIEGIDASTWDPRTEVLTTAGASASSATSGTFIRGWRAGVVTSGGYRGKNTGDIIIETTGGTLVATIPAGLGRSQVCVYTVPDGYTACVRTVFASVEGGKPADVLFFYAADAGVVSAPFTGAQHYMNLAGLSGASSPIDIYAGPFAARTDLWASAVASSTTCRVSAAMEIILVAI